MPIFILLLVGVLPPVLYLGLGAGEGGLTTPITAVKVEFTIMLLIYKLLKLYR